MNTRGGTIGTAKPRPTHRDRSPAVKGHHTNQRNRRGSAADMRRHTAAHTWRESHTGHPRMRRRHGNPRFASSQRRPRRWTSNQRLRDRP